MSKYTTLYFDIDNTLLDFYASEAFAIRQLFKNYGLPSDDKTIKLYSKINKKYWHKFENGEMTKNRILVARFEETLDVLGFKMDCEQINNSYFSLLSDCHFLMPDALEIITYLKNKGYILCAVTNGLAKTQFKRLNESGLSGFFGDNIFVSETVGHQKPEKEYFDYIYEKGKEKDKSKILMIGDSMNSDIRGGINFGIATCWLDCFGEEKLYEPTYTVTKLTELKAFL